MGEPVWLNDDEQQTWRALIICVQLLQQGLDRQLQGDADMPHAYYAILVHLSEAPERTLRMSDLAAALDYSPSRLSHAVTRMETAGWVTRRPSEADRRVTFATLCDAGQDALTAAAPGHVAFVREHVFSNLDVAGQHALRDACRVIVQSLAAAAAPPDAPT